MNNGTDLDFDQEWFTDYFESMFRLVKVIIGLAVIFFVSLFLLTVYVVLTFL